MKLITITEVTEAASEPNDLFDLHELQSSTSLHQVTNRTQQEIAAELERGLPIRDNRWRLRTYKNTFVGTECVDFLVRSQLAESRSAAVELGRKLVTELNLFEHVAMDHEFKDEHLFYRFVEPERRIAPDESLRFSVKGQEDPELFRIAKQLRSDLEVHRYRIHRMNVYKECFLACDAVTYMVEEGIAKTRPEAVALGQRLEIELHLWNHIDQKLKFHDEHLFFRFHNLGDRDESSKSLRSSGAGRSIGQLSQIGNLLKRGLWVKSRTYRLKTYPKCFIASHAVDYMVKEGFCTSREEAVELGQELQNELGLWHHVCNDHQFEDKYFFFRYSATFSGSSTDDDSLSIKSGSSLGESSRVSDMDISDIASKLFRGLNVKDRFYKLKKYQNCFVGSEAVDFMVQAKLASSREDALALGKQLMENYDLFYHVRRAHHFKDEYIFYRFSEDATIGSGTESMDGSTESFNLNLDDFCNIDRDELIQIGEKLRTGVRIQNRQYRFMTFRNCFVASEAVDFLVLSQVAESREYAVMIGKRLEEQLSLFHHVSRDHSFTDEYLYFRFDTGSGNSNQDFIAKTVRESMSEFSMSERDVTESIGIEYDKSLRASEAKLLKAVGSQINDHVHMVMTGGPSGCGKRALVEITFADDPSVLFSSAKFESSENSPFATLRLLFSELCKTISDRPQIHEKIVATLTQNQRMSLLTWIPEVEAFFPESADTDSEIRDSEENDACIKNALLSFLEVICGFMPVVLLLDDIMYATTCTLDILDFILKGSQNNLLLCGNYRDNCVENDHYLMQWKLDMAKVIKVDTILLKNLEEDQIRVFLSHTLRQEEFEVRELAALMKERTHGNFYFLVQLLETLQSLNLLMYNFAYLKWTFSVEAIRQQTDVSVNVAMLLATRITQLSRCVEQTLKLASCFGSSFDPEILKATKSVLFVFDDISYCLSEACKEDLLIRISDREYKFAHDEVRTAAYELLPTGDERKRVHLEIGLKLAKKPALLQDSETLFVCVDQMIKAEDEMQRRIKDGMKVKVSRLFLNAGENAMKLSAFVVASQYLKAGVELLGENAKAAFRDHYDASLQLFSSYAQSELSAGRVEESRKAAEAVLSGARRHEDKQMASLTLFRCFTAEGKLEEQFDFAIRLLESAGLKFPKDPNTLAVRREWEKLKPGIKSDDDILSLRHMTDKSIDFCYDILTDLILTSDATGRLFGLFATARMVQMTLKHGLSKFTPLIFVLVGQGFIAMNNDLGEGKRMIQLGFKIENVVGVAAKGRVLTQACMALGCVQAISQCMYLALDGYKACMELGDIQNAFHGVRVYLWSFYYSGLPFEPLIDDIEKFALQML
jgi:predicted ATPase